jgi:enoyl-CoA hydratase
LLRGNFPHYKFLGADAAAQLLEELHSAGIAGGAVYDALVGAVAREHRIPLATRDRPCAGHLPSAGDRVRGPRVTTDVSPIRIERDGPVFTVLLSRPERRNAVDGATASLLADAFRAFDADDEAAVAVLHGQGGVFCAGADLKAVGTSDGNRVAEDGDGPMGPTRLRLGKPVIAAIAGHAVAGGLELALWCDLRVAEQDAVLGVFCRRWGVPLIDGGTVRLPRLIGMSRAMDMVLTGRPVGAPEAFEIGLVNRLVGPGESRAAAEALARELAAFPQACMREDRLSMLEQDGMSEADALGNELSHGLNSLSEVAAGLERFRAGAGRHGSYTD